MSHGCPMCHSSRADCHCTDSDHRHYLQTKLGEDGLAAYMAYHQAELATDAAYFRYLEARKHLETVKRPLLTEAELWMLRKLGILR